MKIFIDARMTKIGGTYTYANGLLDGILRQDSSNNEYFVLYNKDQKQILPEKSKVLVASSKNPIYWIFWDNFVLPKIVSGNKIDIFHSLKRPNILKVRTKKIITTPSAYPFLHPELQSIGEKLYQSRALRKAIKNADAILAFSETDKDSLVKFFNLESQKCFVSHLATSSEFKKITNAIKIEKTKRKYNLPNKYVLFVGSFYLFKNIPNIIRAFAKFKSDIKTSQKLVLVGRQDGSGAKDVYRTIKELRLEKEIILTGPTTEDLPEIYSSSDVFLFPTLYDSFGMPVLEAMSCGVPTIVSTAGALPEVAGDAALKYDPNDVNGIAEGMKQLISDKELREKMIVKGYNRVKRFSWERCAKETISAYNSIFTKNNSK